MHHSCSLHKGEGAGCWWTRLAGGRSIRGEEGGLVMRKEGGWVWTDVEVVFRETEVLG